MSIQTVAGFDWDDENWPKCGKHGVSKDEIEAVFINRPAVHSHPTHSVSEQRFKAIGRNDEGRAIYLSFVHRSRVRYGKPYSACECPIYARKGGKTI
ncbi:MAG: BrnT family toxin [Candidatus Azotimanducaceae bacterium WSBS_2022_MAG_OTU7]